jgi:hypothetical protein
LVLVFILAGALVFQYFSKANPSPGEPGDSGDGGEAADWQTFKNENLVFEIKYPENWEILHEGYYQQEVGFYHVSFEPENLTEPYAAPVTVLVHNDSIENVSGLISTYETLESESEIIIDGRKSKKQVRTGPEGEFSTVFIPTGGLTYQLRYNNPQFEEVFESMLSTFKFLEGEVAEKIIAENKLSSFMNYRIERDSDEAIKYLTEKAILELGGESNARQYLEGTTNPHLRSYDIVSFDKIPAGTADYLQGGYKVIIKGYEQYLGEEEETYFREGINLVKIEGGWFVNEIIKKQYYK